MNYAITLKALQDCYELYGEKIFTFPKLHLHLQSFLRAFGDRSADRHPLLDLLMRSKFQNIIFYYGGSDLKNEIDCLLDLDKEFPDDISYIVTPDEYLIVNKQIGDDSILTPKLIGPLLWGPFLFSKFTFFVITLPYVTISVAIKILSKIVVTELSPL